VARQASRNASFKTIYIYERSFCQDRLGKNIGKHSKTDRFLAGDLDDHTTHAMWLGEPFAMKVERMSNNGKRTHLICSVLYILRMINLPRQARDNHRES